jgi:hypothetical protein
MQWLLWQKPVAQKLPDQLKKRLIAEFSLDSQMVDKMRFSGKKGRYSDRPVKYIRIFDPSLIEDGRSAAPSYDALVRIPGHRRALLFDGRIETNERVSLIDRRIPTTLHPEIGSAV